MDVRLTLGGQVDRLGVATALEVEHAVARPAMLVVADQRAAWIGRQRGLAGAGEPEEQRRVTRGADVGGAVHRQDALLRQVIVHHREHRLLQLAGVARTADEDHAPREVEDDERSRPCAVPRRIGVHLGGVQHGEVGREHRELRELGPNEHVPHERHVPRARRDVAHREAIRWIGAAVEVLDEELIALAQIGLHVREERIEVRRLHRPVDRTPVDVTLGLGAPDDELVVGRPSGVRRRDRGERAHLGELALGESYGVLHELRSDEVPVNRSGGAQPLSVEACVGHHDLAYAGEAGAGTAAKSGSE